MHRHGLPAAMEGCTGHRRSSDRSSQHIQGSLATCLNRDSCCCRWHQFILPPCIASALTVFSQEHPQGTSPTVREYASTAAWASLPPSLPPYRGQFYYPLVRGTSQALSLLFDGEMQHGQPQQRAHAPRGSGGSSAQPLQHRPRVTAPCSRGTGGKGTAEGSGSSSSPHSTPPQQADRSAAHPRFARHCPMMPPCHLGANSAPCFARHRCQLPPGCGSSSGRAGLLEAAFRQQKPSRNLRAGWGDLGGSQEGQEPLTPACPDLRE